jgi:2'-5' RNA ligase
MSVVRAFIAIDLPLEVQEGLDQISNQLQEQLGGIPVRWVEAENIHLTLKFLGDVSLSNLDVLTEIIWVEAISHKAMEISIGGLGAFPKVRRPRVIWVGVEAPQELDFLQRGIDLATARVGYSPDRRAFSPHLTLGRVSRNATPRDVSRIGEVLSKEKVGFLGVARVSAVHLYRSDLQPGGAVYTKLFSASFGA